VKRCGSFFEVVLAYDWTNGENTAPASAGADESPHVSALRIGKDFGS
jgi:hypothetical protein